MEEGGDDLEGLAVDVVAFDLEMLDADVVFWDHGWEDLCAFESEDEVVEDESLGAALVEDEFFEGLEFMGVHLI